MKFQQTEKSCENLIRARYDRGEPRLIPEINSFCQLQFKTKLDIEISYSVLYVQNKPFLKILLMIVLKQLSRGVL